MLKLGHYSLFFSLLFAVCVAPVSSQADLQCLSVLEINSSELTESEKIAKLQVESGKPYKFEVEFIPLVSGILRSKFKNMEWATDDSYFILKDIGLTWYELDDIIESATFQIDHINPKGQSTETVQGNVFEVLSSLPFYNGLRETTASIRIKTPPFLAPALRKFIKSEIADKGTTLHPPQQSILQIWLSREEYQNWMNQLQADLSPSLDRTKNSNLRPISIFNAPNNFL